MIDRKNFDLADAVILLEIYLNGKAQGITLHEMARQASELMRANAVAQGNEVSPSYRSVSGLMERLGCLRHIIEQDNRKAKPASRMFLEAIELRKTDPGKYNEIRNQAMNYAKDEIKSEDVTAKESISGVRSSDLPGERESQNMGPTMIERKEFDLADAVILLDLYIKGKQRDATVREMAKEASILYRSIATRQGLTISQSYRPVEGLIGRLKSLQITYEGVEIKGKRPTKIFEEAVALYRTNPKEFEKNLNEALGLTNESAEPVNSLKESDGSVNTQSERQEQFYTWLSEQVSRTMLSDIYTCAADLDAFCIDKKLSRASIFEITDSKEIRKIRTALDSNRIFRYTHRKQCKQMLMLLQQYEHFLQDGLPKQVANKGEEKETVPDSTPIVAIPEIEAVPSVPQINNVASITPTVFQEYLTSHGKSANEAWRMISRVESLSSILQSGHHYESLYAINDVRELTSIYLELLSDHRFVALDKQQNGLCSATILAYRSMLENGGFVAIQQTNPSNDLENASRIDSSSEGVSSQESEDIIRLVKYNHLTYVDKRQQGGVLWLIGGMELANFVLQASKHGFHFKYCPGGGKSTEHRTAWYLVEEGQNSEQKAKEDRASVPSPKVHIPPEPEVHINSDQDKSEETLVVIPSLTSHSQATFDDVQRVDNPQNKLLSPLQETRQQEIIISDLSQENKLAFCSFGFIELEGIRYSASATWRGAYVWAMNALLRNHSKQFREILEKERSSRDHSSATCKLENGAIIGVNYSATDLMKRLSSAVTICDIPAKDVLIGYRPIDGCKARVSASPLPKQDTVKTSLAAATSFAYCKPVSCSMNGITLSNAMFWQRVHLWILNQLALKKPGEFEKAMGKVFDNQSHIRNPGYLNDGTVVELNRSATELMRKAADVAKACKIDPEGIVVEYIPPQVTAEVPAKGNPIPAPDRQISIGDTQGLLPTPLEVIAATSTPGIEARESLTTTQIPYAYEQWLVSGKGLSKTMGTIYRQALLLADRMLRQDDPSLSLLTETPEIIRASFARLKLGGDLSSARISQFRMAIEYYAQFREAAPFVKSGSSVPSRQTRVVLSNEVDQRLHGFQQWLENEQQLAEPTARSYRSAIKTSEEYIQENGLSLVLILGNAEQVSKAAHDLLLRSDYLERNIRQNNRYRAALTQYIRFLNCMDTEGTSIAEDKMEQVDELPKPESPRWAELIAKRFPRGWKPSYLTLQKIRMYWQADFDEELSENDDAITRHVMNSCVVYEGTAYAPESVLSEEAREELFSYIDRAFDDGAVKISLSALYNAHKELFSDQRMYDSEMLKAYLCFLAQEHCIVEGDHIVRERGAQFDISQALYDLYMEAGIPISFAEVYKRFPHEDHRSLIDRVKADKRFVYDHMEDGWAYWFAMDLLDLSDDELGTIAQIIEAEIDEKQFMTSSELRSAIEEQMPDLYERFGGFSWIGCRDTIARKLGQQFYFHGAIISRPGREMLAGDVFREYARRHAPLKVDQLWQLCGDMSSTMTIRWESVFEVASRISATDIVPNAWLHFDVEAIDRVLDTFMDEDYLPLSGVTSFTMFPDCGVPWNAYVLEMYVYQFSRRYRLEHTGFAATGLAGVIVLKDSRFQSMDDMVVDLLRRKPELQTKSAALSYLVDHGWQVRKRYDNLDELLARAAKMRKEGQ